MVMRGLRRVLVRGCVEVGKGQAVEATLENPERSDLAGELDLGGPVHSTNCSRRQEWVPPVLQCWGWQWVRQGTHREPAENPQRTREPQVSSGLA